MKESSQLLNNDLAESQQRLRRTLRLREQLEVLGEHRHKHSGESHMRLNSWRQKDLDSKFCCLHNGCTIHSKWGDFAQLRVQPANCKLLVPNTRHVEPGNC